MLGRALEAVSHGITITDPHQPDNPIVYANAAFEHLTGYSAEEPIGRNCRFLQGSERDQPSLEEVRAAIREERECRVVVRNYRKDGTLFWQDLSISAVRDEHGRLTHFVGVHADVTERKLEQDRLAQEHPRQGLVRPGEFLAVAEETGLIVPMGRWVLREACRQAKWWQELYPSQPPLGVSVNLSLRELEHPDMVEDLARNLRDNGLEARSLTLEVSESVAVDKTPSVVNVLKEIKALGVRLAIDDFGTGHSSTTYLEHLPADFLKLDRTLVSELGHNIQYWKLALGIISFARFLGLKTIAEGVETAQQLKWLRTLRCDLVQGFYLREPLRSEAASEIIAKDLL